MFLRQKNLRFKTVQVIKQRRPRFQHQLLALRVLRRPDDPGLGRNEKSRYPPWIDILAHRPRLNPARERSRKALAPGAINLVDALPKSLIQWRHFLSKIIQRTTLDISSPGNF